MDEFNLIQPNPPRPPATPPVEGNLNNGCLIIPSIGGVREARGGFFGKFLTQCRSGRMSEASVPIIHHSNNPSILFCL